MKHLATTLALVRGNGGSGPIRRRFYGGFGSVKMCR
jgi:hypothetical protein